MATIAKLVAEIGGDPTGLSAALKDSAGSITSFVSSTTTSFQKIGKGVDVGKFIEQSIRNLKNTLTTDLGNIRADVFRNLLSPQEATAAGVEAAIQFNQGLAKTIGRLESSGLANIETLRSKIAAEFLATGVRAGAAITTGLDEAAESGGRSFVQKLTATIHRHRSLIPTLAGLLLGEAFGSVPDFADAENKITASLKAAEKVLHSFALLASFLLDPIPGLIAAVVGGSLAAMIGLFAKARENLDEFKKSVKKEIDELINSLDQLGLQKKLKEVEQGIASSGLSDLVKNQFKFSVTDKGFFASGLNDLIAKQARDITKLEQVIRTTPQDISDPMTGIIFTAPEQAKLQKLVDAQSVLINQAIAERDRIRQALLNPLGGTTGFGGQLPTVKITAPAADFKQDLKTVNELIAAEKELNTMRQLDTPLGTKLLGDMIRAHAALVGQLEEVRKTDPFGKMATDLGAVVNSLQEALDRMTRISDQAELLDKIVARLSTLAPKVLPRFNVGGIEIAPPQASPLLDAIPPAFDRFAGLIDGVGTSLVAAFNPITILMTLLQPAIQIVLDLFSKLGQPLLAVLEVIVEGLEPTFRALFPVIKLFGEAIAIVDIIIGTVVGALAQAVGGAIKAIGHFIAQIPFLGGVGKGIENFGNSILGFSNGVKDNVDQMKLTLQNLQNMQFGQVAEDINGLGAAAAAAAGVLNAPQGFKVEFSRFEAQQAHQVAGSPSSTQVATTTLNVGTINIDARSLTKGQLFDMVRDEARSRALGLFGDSTRAAEAFA